MARAQDESKLEKRRRGSFQVGEEPIAAYFVIVCHDRARRLLSFRSRLCPADQGGLVRRWTARERPFVSRLRRIVGAIFARSSDFYEGFSVDRGPGGRN